MKNGIAILAVIGALGGAGCDKFQQSKAAKTKIVKMDRIPVHRFVLTKGDVGVAFDTQTGQLCRTWEWVPRAKLTPQEEASGMVRIQGESSPLCLDLYRQFPSVGTAGESVPDDNE